MTGLPVISGRGCVKALRKAGFCLRRQEGSHLILRRDEPFAQVVVPDHKELDRGTLRVIIRQAGLSVQEFERLLG
jgi:predicted RNA binding protein YcfA (HicA-like mRNA interferase family)